MRNPISHPYAVRDFSVRFLPRCGFASSVLPSCIQRCTEHVPAFCLQGANSPSICMLHLQASASCILQLQVPQIQVSNLILHLLVRSDPFGPAIWHFHLPFSRNLGPDLQVGLCREFFQGPKPAGCCPAPPKTKVSSPFLCKTEPFGRSYAYFFVPKYLDVHLFPLSRARFAGGAVQGIFSRHETCPTLSGSPQNLGVEPFFMQNGAVWT